ARRCARYRRGYRWFEQEVSPGDYLGTAQLRRLPHAVPATEVAVAAVPELVRPDVAAWSVVPTPALLCDELFGVCLDTKPGPWERICEKLGGFLGKLHSVPAAEVAFLPSRNRAAWLTAASAVTKDVATARAEVIERSDGLLSAAASSVSAASRPDCLVHGRFSSGLLVPLEYPVIMGWRESCVGDPDRDLAFFLAELVEAAAVGTGDAVVLPGLARRFLTAYTAAAGHTSRGRLAGLSETPPRRRGGALGNTHRRRHAGLRRHHHEHMISQPSRAIVRPGTVTKRLMFFAGGSHPALAHGIATRLDAPITPQTAHTFANGESFVRFDESVRGSDAFVLQTPAAPLNTWLLEQLIMLDALKRASAKRITVVLPF